jgi:hypothetical protein
MLGGVVTFLLACLLGLLLLGLIFSVAAIRALALAVGALICFALAGVFKVIAWCAHLVVLLVGPAHR